MKKLAVAAFAALALSATSASAADLVTKAKPIIAPPPPAWDLAFGAAIASDYIFRGVTQSNHQASGAVYFEPRYNITKDMQLYAGIGLASISFANRAAAEVDFYAGFRPTFGNFAFDFGVWYYGYPGGECFHAGVAVGNCQANGSLPINLNVAKNNAGFYEGYAKGAYTAGDFLVGVVGYFSPNFLNTGADGQYASITLKWTAPSSVPLPTGVGAYISGEYGYQWLGTSDEFYGLGPGDGQFASGIDYANYSTWNVGFGLTWKVFTLDLRYIDTNLSRADCNAFTSDFTARQTGDFSPINPGGFGSDWCGSRFVARLSADMTLNTNIK
jgi:hypothetical protein